MLAVFFVQGDQIHNVAYDYQCKVYNQSESSKRKKLYQDRFTLVVDAGFFYNISSSNLIHFHVENIHVY